MAGGHQAPTPEAEQGSIVVRVGENGEGGLLSGAPSAGRLVGAAGSTIHASAAPASTATATAGPASARDGVGSRRVGRVQLWAFLAVLALAVGVAGWWAYRQVVGVPVALQVDGQPLVDGAQVLADVEPVFRALAVADGAPLEEGAGCWFAPAAADAFAPGPRVACGPVRLGVAADGQDWVVADVSWSPSANTPGGVTGDVQDLDATAQLDRSTLNRPDGRRPPSYTPVLGAGGVRTEGGRLLTNTDALVDRADADLDRVTADLGASTAAGTRCYLGVTEVDRDGVTVQQSTAQLWCGPLLLRNSTPGQTYAPFPLQLVADDLVSASAPAVDLQRLTRTEPLPAGVVLVRPDGLTPDEEADRTLAPPDAAPLDPGATVLLEALPEDLSSVTVAEPKDGRLETAELSLRLTDLARVDRLGRGDTALVPAPGEDLLVVGYTTTRDDDAPSGVGTATLVIDGRRTALPDWSQVEENAWLVVAVPTGTREAALEVLSEGRPQSISLITGERGPGAPAVLYRERRTVGIGAEVRSEVALPEGDPGRVTVVITEAGLEAWRPDTGWAPVGQGYLRVAGTTEVDEPCCDVRGVDVTASVRLALPDGTLLAPQPAATTADETVFLVPEDLTAAQLQVTAVAEYEESNAAAPAPAVLDLDLPA